MLSSKNICKLNICFAIVCVSIVTPKTGLTQEASFWKSRNIALDSDASLSPVIVAVWDTGVHLETIGESNLWTNPKEQLDGNDSDGNGYVDDLNGIAFDHAEDKTTELMMPLMDGVSEAKLDELALDSKGNSDYLFGVKSKERTEINRKTEAATREENFKSIDESIWFGEFSHGTSVADLCVMGNSATRILTVRQQFSHQPPKPSIELYQKRAVAYGKAVQYMKDNSVRVANLSWSRWKKLFVKSLRVHKMGDSRAERDLLADQILQIEHKALYEAIKNAPEILFVTSAGNLGNAANGKAIPSLFDLPNIIRAGAVDHKGHPGSQRKKYRYRHLRTWFQCACQNGGRT